MLYALWITSTLPCQEEQLCFLYICLNGQYSPACKILCLFLSCKLQYITNLQRQLFCVVWIIFGLSLLVSFWEVLFESKPILYFGRLNREPLLFFNLSMVRSSRQLRFFWTTGHIQQRSGRTAVDKQPAKEVWISHFQQRLITLHGHKKTASLTHREPSLFWNTLYINIKYPLLCDTATVWNSHYWKSAARPLQTLVTF